MTGFGQESDRRRALAAGFDIHIVKPASMDALRSALSFEDS
jgi:CheY-like chemotaxis protein